MISGEVLKARPLTDEEIAAVIAEEIMWGWSSGDFFDLWLESEAGRNPEWALHWTELAALGCGELFWKLKDVFYRFFAQLNRLDRSDAFWDADRFCSCRHVLCHFVKWQIDRNPLDVLALWTHCGLDLLRGANEFNHSLWARLYRLGEIEPRQVVQAALYANCDAENIAPQLLAFLEETGTEDEVLPFLKRISRSKVEHHANFGKTVLAVLEG